MMIFPNVFIKLLSRPCMNNYMYHRICDSVVELCICIVLTKWSLVDKGYAGHIIQTNVRVDR